MVSVGGAKLVRSTAVFDSNDLENSKKDIEDSEIERSNRAGLDAVLGGDAPNSVSDIQSRLSRSQNKKNTDHISQKSQDRYSNTGSRLFRKSKNPRELNSERVSIRGAGENS